MREEPMTDRWSPSAAFLWPAIAAASASEMAALVANQLAHLAADSYVKPAAPPGWATHNRITLELPTMRLRDFSTARDGVPTLVCAPFALHSSTLVDFAPGHSLVATLQVC